MEIELKNSPDKILSMSGLIKRGDSKKLENVLVHYKNDEHLVYELKSKGGFIGESSKMVSQLLKYYSTCIAYDFIDSSAILPLLASKEAYCKKGTTFFFHKPRFRNSSRKEASKNFNDIVSFISLRTRMNPQQVISFMEEEKTFSDTEALSWGIVRSIV